MTNIISVRDLETEDIEIVERLVERLREKARRKKEADTMKTSGFKRSAGSWKGLVDPDELIDSVYADRLITTRPEAKL